MSHPIKKTYKPGSPGHARKEAGITLTAIKKQISSTRDRLKFRERGLLA